MAHGTVSVPVEEVQNKACYGGCVHGDIQSEAVGFHAQEAVALVALVDQVSAGQLAGEAALEGGAGQIGEHAAPYQVV